MCCGDRQRSELKRISVKQSTMRHTGALEDVLPVDTRAVYMPLLKELGFNPNNRTTDLAKPSGIVNVACAAVLEYRHHDGSNQLGDSHEVPTRTGPDTPLEISQLPLL